jgi:hypothetical protein
MHVGCAAVWNKSRGGSGTAVSSARVTISRSCRVHAVLRGGGLDDGFFRVAVAGLDNRIETTAV